MTSCQRWRSHRHSWRRTSEGGFDPSRYEVVDLTPARARAFVMEHHYSSSCGSVNLASGLLDRAARSQLVGVAAWGSPSSPFTLANTFPGLEAGAESTELLRFVLLDEVPANAESWFLAAAHAELARRAGIAGVVAFSDPVPRRRADGLLITPGHVGTIYQASNATLTGRSKARAVAMLPDGRVLSERALSKARSGQRGGAGVIARLVAMGAREPAQDDVAKWLPRALADVGARPVAHPGNFRYAFTIGPRRQRVRVAGGPLSYPKRDLTVTEQLEML